MWKPITASQNIQLALDWMIQREEYLKSSKSQHCHSLFILHLSCTVSSSLPTVASALQLEGSTALLGSWLYCVFILHLGCTVSSSFISAVLCVHPSSQLYCVFILHLSCTVSSSLPTLASALQLEGSTALLGSWLYCVFILHLGCTVSSSFISAVLCVHPSSQLYCVFILHLSCTVSSSLPTVASALQLEGSTALLGSWLYCVFIFTTYCWCSLIGMILPTRLFGISTGAHC